MTLISLILKLFKKIPFKHSSSSSLKLSLIFDPKNLQSKSDKDVVDETHQELFSFFFFKAGGVEKWNNLAKNSALKLSFLPPKTTASQFTCAFLQQQRISSHSHLLLPPTPTPTSPYRPCLPCRDGTSLVLLA